MSETLMTSAICIFKHSEMGISRVCRWIGSNDYKTVLRIDKQHIISVFRNWNAWFCIFIIAIYYSSCRIL